MFNIMHFILLLPLVILSSCTSVNDSSTSTQITKPAAQRNIENFERLNKEYFQNLLTGDYLYRFPADKYKKPN